MRILDHDKVTQLYTITMRLTSIFNSKPHILVHRGASTELGALIGTATFHTLSSRVSMVVHSRPIEFASAGVFTRAHCFDSGGGTLTWRSDGVLTSNLRLVNERKEWIARFLMTGMAMSKVGKIELSGWDLGGDELDQVVVSAVVMGELERRRRSD